MNEGSKRAGERHESKVQELDARKSTLRKSRWGGAKSKFHASLQVRAGKGESCYAPMTAQGVNVARKSDKKATGSQVMNSG